MAQISFLSKFDIRYDEWFDAVKAGCSRKPRVDPHEVASELYLYFRKRDELQPGWLKNRDHVLRLTRKMAPQQAGKLMRSDPRIQDIESLDLTPDFSARAHRREPARARASEDNCHEMKALLEGLVESDVLDAAFLSCLGKTQKQIAELTGISVSTVRRKIETAESCMQEIADASREREAF